MVFWLAYNTPDQAANIMMETGNTKLENRLKKKRGVLEVQV